MKKRTSCELRPILAACLSLAMATCRFCSDGSAHLHVAWEDDKTKRGRRVNKGHVECVEGTPLKVDRARPLIDWRVVAVSRSQLPLMARHGCG